MRWIAVVVVAFCAGCARDKVTVRVESKPLAQDVTVGVTWEVNH